VWERFGNVPNYVEPFFGSGAVLLGRPDEPGIETINDKDCLVANFWRALQSDPDGVVHFTDWPVNEADLSARHLWLMNQEEFQERMKTDPDYYDIKIAGWWVWGISLWIGSGWCTARQRPHLGDAGKGVHRQRPHLGDAGKGVHRQRPHLGDAGKETFTGNDRTLAMRDYMGQLAERIARVRVCCGDWSRVCGPSPTVKLGTTGVFLDPPYTEEAERRDGLYSTEDLSVAHKVREWAIEWGEDRRMRIALCGYEGEHSMPDSWECVAWKAHGGYGSQGTGDTTNGRENSTRERIWFSPHCVGSNQGKLF
jgi:DNA adenine methylase